MKYPNLTDEFGDRVKENLPRLIRQYKETKGTKFCLIFVDGYYELLKVETLKRMGQNEKWLDAICDNVAFLSLVKGFEALEINIVSVEDAKKIADINENTLWASYLPEEFRIIK